MRYLTLVFLLLVAAASAEPRAGELVGAGAIIEPFSVDFAADGSCYGVEFLKSNRVYRLAPSGSISIVAGVQAETQIADGDRGARDGADPLQANFNGMHDLAVGADGSVYLADTFACRVRKIDRATGRLSTVVGTGVKGYDGDGGPADRARIAGVFSLSFNRDCSRLFMADLPNQRIRVLDLATGAISTFAGTGQAAAPRDGALAAESPLLDPRAVLVGKEGRVYVLSRRGNALLEVDGKGVIRTVVNGAGERGYAGDGGPGLSAKLNGPKHLALDGQGRVLIADTENHAIRRYDPADGTIALVAGVPGKQGAVFSAGDPLATQLARPHGSRVHDGWIYLCDSENNRVLRFPYPQD